MNSLACESGWWRAPLWPVSRSTQQVCREKLFFPTTPAIDLGAEGEAEQGSARLWEPVGWETKIHRGFINPGSDVLTYRRVVLLSLRWLCVWSEKPRVWLRWRTEEKLLDNAGWLWAVGHSGRGCRVDIVRWLTIESRRSGKSLTKENSWEVEKLKTSRIVDTISYLLLHVLCSYMKVQ